MPTETTYPWYKEISAATPLEQGDIILKCQIVKPIVEASVEHQNLDADVNEYDVIIMSQSCDLAERKIDLVLVCPFRTLADFGTSDPQYKSEAYKEKLRRGNIVGLHLLNQCKINGAEDYLVVDFKSVYAVPFDFLINIASSRGNRIRLLPPYREHLSQAFARFFMRVGLPADIPSFISG